MKTSYFKSIKDFKETQPAHVLIARAFREIMPAKGNYIGFCLSLVLALFFSLLMGYSSHTVKLFSNTVAILMTIQLAVFACIFTVYSILLGFLNNEYMKKLAEIEIDDATSMLKRSTAYYESVLFLYFINIGITGIANILVNCLAPHFSLTGNSTIDTGLAIVLLLIYFAFSFRVFYELKSTIYNTIVLFRASIAYRFMAFSKEENLENNNVKEDKHNDY